MAYADLPAYVTRVMDVIRENGGRSWLVGGCVRDVMLGAVPHDYDIASDLTPDRVRNAFDGYTVIETGIKHGTVTVHIEGRDVEVTTLRRDGRYSDGRHPESVSFVDDIKEDLARRDFTVNAAAWSPEDGLCDPFGARADAESGVIRCVGDPRERFDEDALRILRALRFASTLGFVIEEGTDAAVRERYPLLRGVSRERIRDELLRLICGKNAVEVLLGYKEIIGFIMPEVRASIGYDPANSRHRYDVYEHCVRCAGGVPPKPALRLAALFHDMGKPSVAVSSGGRLHFPRHEAAGVRIAGEVMRSLRIDRRTANDVCRLILRHDSYPKTVRASVRRDIAEATPRLWYDLEAMRRADNAAKAEGAYADDEKYFSDVEELAAAILADGDCIDPSMLAVGGADLMKLGVSGVVIGDVRRRLYDEVVDGKIENDADALISRARELISAAAEKQSDPERKQQ